MRSAEQCHRLAFEANLLRKYFPNFRIYNPNENTFFDGWIRTINGNRFKLRVVVPDGYPYSEPALFVIEPATLYQQDGESTINSLGTSHGFHTHGNGPDGVVCICHTVTWDSSMTIIQVLKKGALWCEAYQAHRREGKEICKFLSR